MKIILSLSELLNSWMDTVFLLLDKGTGPWTAGPTIPSSNRFAPTIPPGPRWLPMLRRSSAGSTRSACKHLLWGLILVNCSLHHCLSFLIYHLPLHLTPPGFFTCFLSYHGSFAEKLWWQTIGFSPLEPGPGVSMLGLELLFDESFAIVELLPCLWLRCGIEEFVSSKILNICIMSHLGKCRILFTN